MLISGRLISGGLMSDGLMFGGLKSGGLMSDGLMSGWLISAGLPSPHHAACAAVLSTHWWRGRPVSGPGSTSASTRGRTCVRS